MFLAEEKVVTENPVTFVAQTTTVKRVTQQESHWLQQVGRRSLPGGGRCADDWNLKILWPSAGGQHSLPLPVRFQFFHVFSSFHFETGFHTVGKTSLELIM